MSKSSYVVMSNDYPDAVFSAEEGETNEAAEARADAYAAKRMQEQRDEIAKKHTCEYKPPPRVSYRVYEFEINKEGRQLDLANLYA